MLSVDPGYRDYLERCQAGEACEDDCELYGHDADLNEEHEYEDEQEIN